MVRRMKRTVREVARLTGISVRTLHYYDEIGLLHPSEVTPAGYRLYGEEAVERLGQILFFRELDFPLREIAAILDSPSFDRQEAMANHRRLLELKRARLDRLIRLVDQNLKGESNMGENDLKAFDMEEYEATRAQYAAEAKERWGETEAYRESEKRTGSYRKEDWARIQQEAEGIFSKLAANRDKGPSDPAVQECVRAWQEHITRHYYTCTNEILQGLGQMYAADERFTKWFDERYGSGTAQFVSEAIRLAGK